MGTDGDLRKLKLSKARNVLRGFGVPEEEVCSVYSVDACTFIAYCVFLCFVLKL